MRRGSASIAANPVLIGAATTLVVLVAVFLAYNANAGLPFVPSYELRANLPNAANLVVGNDVRIGGTRVGTVDAIDPVVNQRTGAVSARLTLKLETTVKPLPVDSTVIVRPRSALGLKYVQITRGRSRRGFQDGATIPLRQATPQPVELDEVLNTFDDRTRAAGRTNVDEFGTAFAGRGADLNQAIEDFNPLLINLVPVMQNLSDPRTQLARTVQALGRTARIVAPVAETQATLVRNLDTTFAALARVADPLRQTIAGGPPALDAAIRDLPATRPFLANTQGLFADLRPGAGALRTAAPVLADAIEEGTPVLRRSQQLSARLEPTFRSIERLADDPLVALGVRDLTNTARILNPTLATLTPAQTVCNYITLWFRNVSSLLSEGGSNGTTQRFIILATPQGPNNEGGPSSAPANGPNRDNFLHTNPYPNTASPGQPNECEAANETFAVGRQSIGNVPGNQGTRHDRTTRSTTK
jgi:phospholipid/cholesterol/gamma-HCH transport system substrate-binding protein